MLLLGLGIGGCAEQEPLASSGLSFVVFCSELEEFCSMWKCFKFVERGTIKPSRCTNAGRNPGKSTVHLPTVYGNSPGPTCVPGSAVLGERARKGKSEVQVGLFKSKLLLAALEPSTLLPLVAALEEKPNLPWCLV